VNFLKLTIKDTSTPLLSDRSINRSMRLKLAQIYPFIIQEAATKNMVSKIDALAKWKKLKVTNSVNHFFNSISLVNCHHKNLDGFYIKQKYGKHGKSNGPLYKVTINCYFPIFSNCKQAILLHSPRHKTGIPSYHKSTLIV
jgi:hypothetical protein